MLSAPSEPTEYANVIDKKKTRSRDVLRGEFQMCRSADAPTMIILSWMDSRPVHFLSTGSSDCSSTVNRRSGSMVESVPCPKLVTDYHAFHGGVDRHDQLRLQCYSLQLSNRFYK